MIHHSTVRTRAPLRVSFAGGGTDLPEFYERHEWIQRNIARRLAEHRRLREQGSQPQG